MPLKKLLFKPRWRHKDPGIRAPAVSTGTEPELLAALPEIALEDEDERVRCAAIPRLHDLSCLQAALARKPGPGETELIANRIRTLTASRGPDRPALDLRLAVVADTGDRALLEQVALHGPEPEFRAAAIERIERQGVLGDAALTDPEPANRRLAAARIQQHSTLQRVIDGSRKTDKVLHHELLQRMQAEQLAAGEPDAVRREALAICEALEALAMSAEGEAPEVLTRLDERWRQLDANVAEDLRLRHRLLIERIKSPAPAAMPEPMPEPAIEAQPRAQADTRADPPAPEPREAPVADPGPRAPNLEPKFEALEAQVATLKQQAEAGELHHALETRAAILAAAENVQQHPRWRRLKQEMATVHGRLRELREWQHWSNNKIRKRLIRDMQALPGSGLHPDALLEKLKELQTQWKKLEHSEQIPGEKHFSASTRMWRQFSAAGNAAFELTKPYLDKRTELRQGVLDQVKALATRLQDLSKAESPDWDALRKAVIEAGRHLRDIGALPAGLRKQAEAGLRKALKHARARLEQHHEDVEKAKRKLIREASQLVHIEDREEAIAKAKSLQAEWKKAGRMWRGPDQKLWKEFRAPIEPLFEQLEQKQQAEKEQQAEELAGQQALCDEMKAVLALDLEDLPRQQGRVQGLKDDWAEQPHPSPRLRQQFQESLREFELGLRRAQRQRAAARRDRWWAKSTLLHEMELALSAGKRVTAKMSKAWPDVDCQANAVDDALDERHAAALSGEGEWAIADDTVRQRAHLLCIQLEFLAGLPSPDEDKQLRMNHQVERLSESMSGARERLPALEEARAIEHEWLTLPLLDDASFLQFTLRIKAALAELEKE